MYVHWQSRYQYVIAELPKADARKLVTDLVDISEAAGYSTRLIETLIASLKEATPSD